MPYPAELLRIAHEVVWFKTPEDTLADTAFFLAHVMTYGTSAEIAVVKKYFADAQFREALEHAPPGVFDPRSWAYWNSILGRVPVPDMPRRRFGN